MANQVLSRPMFKPSPNQVSPTVSGIGAMTTPDQNAQALKNMFAPQAAYKRGGEVIDGVAHFAEGDEVVAPTTLGGQQTPPPAPQQEIPDRVARELLANRAAPPAAPPSPSNVPVQRGIETSEAGQQAMAKISAGRTGRNPRLVQEGFADLQRITDEAYAKASIPAASPEESFRRVTSGLDAATPEMRARMEDKDRLDQTVPGGMFSRSVAPLPVSSLDAAPAPVPRPPDPKEESIQTNLQAIKERRAASEKQREENKNLALLSAGLGMMAGTNRNAFANIGAGGQQGIATFAGLEKARREDDASRRQEQYQQQQLGLQNKQLAQQREIAFAQIEKDPDTIRLYKALGGGDLEKGFRLVSSDATLKSAQLIAADTTAPETERATARAFLNSRINEAMGSRSGTSNLPPVRLISR